jgi:DDE domain
MVLLDQGVQIFWLANLDGRFALDINGIERSEIGAVLVDGYRLGDTVLIDFSRKRRAATWSRLAQHKIDGVTVLVNGAIEIPPCVASPAPRGIWTKCSWRCAASLIRCGEQSISTALTWLSYCGSAAKAAAKRFFERVWASCPEVPRKNVTDQRRSYPAAKAEIPKLADVKHVFVKASAWLNSRTERSHQPMREFERRMRGFRDQERTQAFLSSFGPIGQHFALKRHLLPASLYRKQLAARFAACHRFIELAQNPATFWAKLRPRRISRPR